MQNFVVERCKPTSPPLPRKVHISSTFLSPQYYKNEDLALKASNSPLVNLKKIYWLYSTNSS